MSKAYFAGRLYCIDLHIRERVSKHSKQHKSTEEFKLEQDRIFVEQQAEELAKLQDDFIDYAVDHHGDSIGAYLENVELQKVAAEYDAFKQKGNQAISAAWMEFNSYTASYFNQYREKKHALYEEIKRARQGAKDSRKQLNNILNDIAYSNGLFISLIRLFFAFFIALETASMEREVKRLQEANDILKQQAKEVMQKSNNVSTILRTKELDDIEEALLDYEIALENAKEYIANHVRNYGVISMQDQER